MITVYVLLAILYVTMAIWVYVSVENNTIALIGQKEMVLFSLLWPVLCPTCVLSALLIKMIDRKEED